MSVMQRTITIKRNVAFASGSLFDRISDELKQSVVTWTGLHADDMRFADWPMGDHWHAGKHIWVKGWQSEHEPLHRLLTLVLEESRYGVDWKTLIKLGAIDEERVVLFDTREIRPLQAQLQFSHMDALLDFLAGYSCEDEDGRIAGRPLILHKKRVPDFIRFLEQPPVLRQLPVVLISATNSDKSYLVDQRKLALRLLGLAHVITLNQHATWWSDELPLAHKCFDGAVRVYLPGYSRDDPSSVHRWWHKDRLAADSAVESTDEIVRLVIEKTYPRFRIHRIFPQLHRELNEVRHAAVMQRLVADLRESLEEKQGVRFEEFYEEYAKVDRERDYWQGLAKSLDDEVRALRHQINAQWEKPVSIPEEEVAEPCVLLSSQAQRSFAAFDQSERSEFRTTVLNKLLNEGLRKGQSEVMSTSAVAYYVYPRKKSASGQRVLYVLDGVNVKICELFASHDEYMNMRDAGVDLTRYTAYVAVEELD